jgi:diaminohydroxyphosphoribosylaminopyrimidine deaminase/5-amino-6-(5-phosphoribosylamino)uracil reductase
MNDDSHFMRIALALAERGRGTTSPNPMVGALVVDDEGVIVGRGAHRIAGGPHAEVVALEDAGSRAQGATLYCTLEPCSHTGRTGPCAPLVARAGIRRAVIAMADPNPLVHGAGLTYLRDRGIQVTVGVRGDEAARQNAVFLAAIQRDRPYVIVKIALSLDVCVGRLEGERMLLTGAAANRRVHRQRAEVDAIAIGSGTVLADDPLLTPRGAYRGRPLTRVIFDRRLRTPPDARLFSTLDAGPVIVATTEVAARQAQARAEALTRAGATVLAAATGELAEALRVLKRDGMTSIVLEGGPALHRGAFEADIVDAVEIYLTPRRLAPGGVPWLGEGRLSWDALHDRRAVWLGEDVLVEGLVHTDVHRHH